MLLDSGWRFSTNLTTKFGSRVSSHTLSTKTFGMSLTVDFDRLWQILLRKGGLEEMED